MSVADKAIGGIPVAAQGLAGQRTPCGIRFDRVRKDSGTTTVIRDISIEIEPGEFVPSSVRRAVASRRSCASSPDWKS